MTADTPLPRLVELGRSVDNCSAHGADWCSCKVKQYLAALRVALTDDPTLAVELGATLETSTVNHMSKDERKAGRVIPEKFQKKQRAVFPWWPVPQEATP